MRRPGVRIPSRPPFSKVTHVLARAVDGVAAHLVKHGEQAGQIVVASVSCSCAKEIMAGWLELVASRKEHIYRVYRAVELPLVVFAC